MATIKGKWLLSKEPNLSQAIVEKVNFDNVVFGSLTLQCHTIEINNSYITYHVTKHIPPMSFGGDSHIAYDTEKGWYRVGHEIVDFGTTEQTVSDAFLAWMNENGERLIAVSGCWKLNKNISLPSTDIAEKVTFESGMHNGRLCRDIYVSNTGISYRTKEGETLPVYDGQWNVQNAESDYYLLINFGTKRFVTNSFHNFLQANGQESGSWDNSFEKIRGVRCWKEEVDLPTQPITFHIRAKSAFGEDYPTKWFVEITSNDIFATYRGRTITLYNKDSGWSFFNEGSCQVVDFGLADQLITKTAKNYIDSQSVDISDAETLVFYNGKAIAPMTRADSYVMLKCMNKKMASNVEILSIPNAGVQDLTVLKPGVAVNKGFYFTTKEYWYGDIEWDFSIGEAWGGYPLGFKKLSDFIVPEDVGRVLMKESRFDFIESDPDRGVYERLAGAMFAPDDMSDFLGFYVLGDGATTTFGLFTWVKDAQIFNQMYGTTEFEDNSVYISNWIFMQVAGERYGGIESDELCLTLTMPCATDKDCTFSEPLILDYNGDVEGTLRIYQNGSYEVDKYVDSVDVYMPATYIIDNVTHLNLLSAPNQSVAIVLGGED